MLGPRSDGEGGLMSNDRYERGWERLRELAGDHGERVIEGVRDVAPDLARYVVEFGYGDVYSRPGLDDRTRQLAAIAALTALGGAEPQLENTSALRSTSEASRARSAGRSATSRRS